MKRKRGEAKLTQETLAQDIFDDPMRKSMISRIENGKVTPQEATIQKLNAALTISEAEMAPIRQSRALSARDLDQIPGLSRQKLEDLTARFGIENPYDKGDDELRDLLTDKANEHRALVQQIAALPDHIEELQRLKTDAQAAVEAMDLEKADQLLAAADLTETALNAQTKVTRANTALLRHRPEEAFHILSAAAESFRGVDATKPAQFRLHVEDLLYQHGLRYGGDGMALSERMIRNALEDLSADKAPEIWAKAKNSLAIALQDQGNRTEGDKGADMLAKAVAAYRDALTVYNRDTYPVDWAMTQNNLANALSEQDIRTDGDTGEDLLAQAVTAFRDSLTVFTRDAHPMDWAMMQNNLGSALSEQGIRTDGYSGTDLLAQAVTAFRDALIVRTRETHPVHWAGTQANIARVELARATHSATDNPELHIQAALSAVDVALTVYDPVHMSYQHAKATELRDDILAAMKDL